MGNDIGGDREWLSGEFEDCTLFFYFSLVMMLTIWNQHCTFCFARKNMYYFSITSICHIKSTQMQLATRSALLLQNSELILSVLQAHAMQTQFGILAAKDNLGTDMTRCQFFRRNNFWHVHSRVFLDKICSCKTLNLSEVAALRMCRGSRLSKEKLFYVL